MPALMIDEVTPIITKIAEISGGAANESLSIVGARLQSRMRDRARAYGVLNTGQEISRLRRKLVSSDRGGEKKAFSRLSHITGEQASGGETMADLIRTRVSEAEHKLIVGWANVKGWSPTKYKDGVAVGKMPRVKGVGNGFKKIGEKMEFGGEMTLNDRQRNFFKASGWGKAAKTGRVVFKPRPVVNPVFSASRNVIFSTFEKQYMATILKVGNGK